MRWIVSFLAAVVVSTFVEYFIHRLMHAGVLLHARHVAHHKDGWGQGFLPELRDYLAPGLFLILPPWFLGAEIGTGWTIGCVASAVFMAYAHQLQHDNPRACRWMRLPVHYVHHRDQMWHHNFGLGFDWWDRLLGTYKVVPFGEEFLPEEEPRGALDIHWGRMDETRAAEHQRVARARRSRLRRLANAGQASACAPEPAPPAEKMGSAVLYEGLGAELAADGIGALLPRLKDAIKTLSPKIIVIDSFKAIHDMATSPQEMRLMLHEVAGLLAAYNTTVLLVGEYRHEDIATFPEFAVADGIIELARNALGTRDERYLRVFKLRGSSYRRGFHAFDITADGLQVYPRLVSPVEAASYKRAVSRAPSGVPGLDPMLRGGFWTGSATLLAGPTGSGKTTMAIQFIAEGLRRGERCLLVNFQENPTQLAYQLEQIGGTLDDEARGRLELLYYSAVELSIDRIIVSVFQALRRSAIRRVVIDALGDLATAASDPLRMHDYLYALVQHFAVMGVSSLLTLETDPPIMASDAGHGRLSHMTDNIVFLEVRAQDGIVGRTLRIAKARGVAHDLQARELQIGPQGLRIVE